MHVKGWLAAVFHLSQDQLSPYHAFQPGVDPYIRRNKAANESNTQKEAAVERDSRARNWTSICCFAHCARYAVHAIRLFPLLYDAPGIRLSISVAESGCVGGRVCVDARRCKCL